MNAWSRNIGEAAAKRLVQSGAAEIQDGLTDAEFARIERHFGFKFADDHRSFLAAGLPVREGLDERTSQASWGWPA
ncbi:hypothetical protein LWF15_27575 [Kineosporia rhizophila]|uniref:hypothetical protein n=1 Tax=Kineosporia TaxID=49184 RepID=UPI000A45472B|nr:MULTISPECIES: hypothetical protein [Kineosporia]MCE0539264.1 hypothetical protein [Kineosporia rhizophila]GLY14450.1 hypothetical protein Kisp01_14650 [Kineosporia sp. NBRC 101677]